MSSSHIEAAVSRLYNWQYKRRLDTPNFSDLLFDLIRNADKDNRPKLEKAYPLEYMAMEMWKDSEEHGNELFKRFGLMH